MVTSAQLRAARGLLNWTVRDLALKAAVHRNTVTRIETEETKDGVAFEKLVGALQAAGVEFIDGKRPGVRFKG